MMVPTIFRVRFKYSATLGIYSNLTVLQSLDRQLNVINVNFGLSVINYNNI